MLARVRLRNRPNAAVPGRAAAAQAADRTLLSLNFTRVSGTMHSAAATATRTLRVMPNP
jgi:hypothetical protein